MRTYIPAWYSIGISKERYLELTHFCRQYPEWVSGIRTRSDSAAAASVLRRIQIVNECAAAVAGGEWYNAIIQNVCQGKPYFSIEQSDLPTSARNSFFKARKEFFVKLNTVLMERGV